MYLCPNIGYTEFVFEMTAANVQLPDETEIARIERWRADELEHAGYSIDAAQTLAVRHDVDLHFAVDLLNQGCPPETALAILI